MQWHFQPLYLLRHEQERLLQAEAVPKRKVDCTQVAGDVLGAWLQYCISEP
jgi:hypothetical protein